MSRFVVTEIEGFLTHATDGPIASHSRPGVSTMVVDTLSNRRVVGMWRSEDYGGNGWQGYEAARRHAARTAEALNRGEKPLATHSPRPSWRFRPTCPRCCFRCDPGSVRCAECGASLT